MLILTSDNFVSHEVSIVADNLITYGSEILLCESIAEPHSNIAQLIDD